MLEKLSDPANKSVSKPCDEVLTLLKSLKKENRPLTVAEIGIGIGATTIGILKKLGKEDNLYIFDFQDTVDDFSADIARCPEYANGVNIVAFGNSRKTMDSYNWSLAKMILDNFHNNISFEIFDVIYLDGAHTFLYDSTACCLLKQMLKPSGYIVFDDTLWSMAAFGKLYADNPERSKYFILLKERYTDEQLEIPHVAMVIDIFIKTDKEYRQVKLKNMSNNRDIYQKSPFIERNFNAVIPI